MIRVLNILAVVVALAVSAAPPASAVRDGTSNTLVAFSPPRTPPTPPGRPDPRSELQVAHPRRLDTKAAARAADALRGDVRRRRAGQPYRRLRVERRTRLSHPTKVELIPWERR